MNQKIILGVIVMITLGITATAMVRIQSAEAIIAILIGRSEAAPVAITGDNVYVAWWTNKTGNDEVMFRASTDAGKTFGDKINLSNSPNANSTRVEIDPDANSVVVNGGKPTRQVMYQL
jgi:hypothetical protein